MSRWITATVAVAIALASPGAGAWEAQTTHAGLTEQAATNSELHERLSDDLGLDRGLFASLIIPPADAEGLFEWLGELDPAAGYVPDSRGRMHALGWLTLGAIVADSPARHAAHHFFDPATGEGLDDHTLRGLTTALRHRILSRLEGASLIRSGMPATEWATHPDNPMRLEGFVDQYARAVRSRTPGERERHLAGALIAAGALLHVLQDMGSPSHVRTDLASHLQDLDSEGVDVGSRFEHVASLAYGRLGVPAPDREVGAADLLGFFTTEDHRGLADRTALRYFSENTLPRNVEAAPDTPRQVLGKRLASSLRREHPAPLPSIDLRGAAASADGVRLVDDRGVCLARYRLSEGRLRWFVDDDCRLEQAAAILPEVAAYSTGLLDWLFRGSFELELEGNRVRATPEIELGAGTVEIFWDDARGVRAPHGDARSIQGADADRALAPIPAAPEGAGRVTVLFTGEDAAGQPLVATGTIEL